MLFDKIKNIIVTCLSIDPDTVTLEANLKTDLDADSLDAIEVIMAIEEEFEIEIPDDVAKGITTIKDIVTYLEANVEA